MTARLVLALGLAALVLPFVGLGVAGIVVARCVAAVAGAVAELFGQGPESETPRVRIGASYQQRETSGENRSE